jgi:hypothetical protein
VYRGSAPSPSVFNPIKSQTVTQCVVGPNHVAVLLDVSISLCCDDIQSSLWNSFADAFYQRFSLHHIGRSGVSSCLQCLLGKT